MKRFETIMTIIISIFAATVIGAWILTLGELAVPVMISVVLMVIIAMVQPERETIVIEVEYED